VAVVHLPCCGGGGVLKPKSFTGDRRKLRVEAEARYARAPPASASQAPSATLQHELQVHQIELEMQNEELLEAKQALEEARDRFLDLYDFAPVGYLTLGAGELIEEANLAVAALLGIDRSRLRGRRFAGLIAPQGAARWRRYLDEVRRGSEPLGVDLQLQRGDRSVFDAHLACHRQESDVAEAPLRLVLTDVTEQRRSERALWESRLRLSLVLEGSEEGAWDWLVGEETSTVSRRFREIAGLAGEGEESAIVNAHWIDAIHTEDAARVRTAAAALVQGSLQRYDFEYRLRSPDGGWRWVRSRARAVARYPDGTAQRVAGTLADVTDRKLAETLAQRSQERFRALIDKASDLIVVLDAAGCVIFFSPSTTEKLGWSSQELLGKQAFELIHPDDLAHIQETFAEGVGVPGTTAQVSARVRHQDGSWRLLEASGRNLLEDPAVHGIVVNARDVTEQRRMEEQFQHAQKLESVGRLAGGVAHDFNNLLTVILSGIEELKRDLADEVPVDPELVEDIGAAGARARNLTRQLLAFARKQVLAPVVLDLNRVVRASETMLRRILREDVELKVDLQPGLWSVFCDEGQVEQVLMNLVVNARDAMPGHGTLSVETRNSDLPLAEDPEPTPGQWVRLLVRDSGSGMSPEVQAHLFEPFFTTKPQGKGTGLGLATIHGIVSQAGGHLHVRSEPGQGSTFVVCFPRRLGPAPGFAETSPAALVARGTETILVVEDEPAVRQVAVRALRGAGYQVLVAGDGGEAQLLGDAQLARLDLLLTDVIMPGQSGLEVAEALGRRHPGLPVLYMSGYAQEAFAGMDVAAAGIQFLPKPFTAAALLARVRAALDAPRPEQTP
jgi:two-component system cell cycle sensor histidine kinase/response regulator CckA